MARVVEIHGKCVEVPPGLIPRDCLYDGTKRKAQTVLAETLALARRWRTDRELAVGYWVLGELRKARRFVRRVRRGLKMNFIDRSAVVWITGLDEKTPDGILADAVEEL
jgi:hypothetical protein